MNGEFAALAARINAELLDLERTVKRAIEWKERATRSNDEAYWSSVAMALHSCYTGIERVFEDIARTVDRMLPSSSHWHRELLWQMMGEVPDIRPAVIRQETRDCLEEYLRFRHLVRNAYTFNFRPGRLQELVNDLPACWKLVRDDLEAFIRFLTTISINE